MGLSGILRNMMSTHDERGRKTSDRFRMTMRRAIRGMLDDVAGRILDAGGADGLLFDPNVSTLAGDTTVLDFDIPALAEGIRAYGGAGTFVCGDITDMPFPDGAFNAAVCIGTFYNFPTADLVGRGIREMARVTGPDGRVIVEFRNADNPVVAFAYRHAEKYDPSLNGLPLNAYSFADASRMIREAGLKVKRVKYIGIPLKRLAIGFIVEAIHDTNGGKKA